MNTRTTTPIGTSAHTGVKVSLTEAAAIYNTAVNVGNSNGKFTATAKVAFDQQFIEQARGSKIFVHWNDAPAKQGWYQVDRENHSFKPIDEEKAGKLKWHERLYVSKSVLPAVKERRPLALHINCGYYKDALVLSGACLAEDVARVAQVEAGHEAVPIRDRKLLRTFLGL